MTAAVRARGVPVDDPQDRETGGYDLLDDGQYHQLLRHWESLLKEFNVILFHLGTDCSSVTKVRDRSFRTRLRSSHRPWGLNKAHPKVIDGEQVGASDCAYCALAAS